jgi:hypothetical protein
VPVGTMVNIDDGSLEQAIDQQYGVDD